jgi:hypothetical protein
MMEFCISHTSQNEGNSQDWKLLECDQYPDAIAESV